MLDHGLRAAFRNYATLFLLVALFTVPLHLAYSYAYRTIIEVSDVHTALEDFPNYRSVEGVTAEQLRISRTVYLGLAGVEILLIPLLARASRRVVEVDTAEGVPTVPDALRHAVRSGYGVARGIARAPVAVVVAVVASAALGYGLERAGLVAMEPVPDALRWAFAGLVRGASRAAAAPFTLGVVAVSTLMATLRRETSAA